MKQYRQGDVFIQRIRKMPKDVQPLRRTRRGVVLAEGEVTGHAHAIKDRGADLYGGEIEARFLRVLAEGGVALTHEEHATITLPKGDYEIRIQREYSPEAIRNVRD